MIIVNIEVFLIGKYLILSVLIGLQDLRDKFLFTEGIAQIEIHFFLFLTDIK